MPGPRACRGALILAVIVALVRFGNCQTCAEDAFTARCQLSAGGEAASFWTNETMWRRCVRKSCGVFPAVANGATSAASVDVGDTTRLVCSTGYEVTGGDAEIRCGDECGFSHFPTCVKVACPSTEGANTEPIAEGAFGDTRDLQCDAGYKASLASAALTAGAATEFNAPCAASLTATCAATGAWVLGDTCVPLTCPAFDATDDALKCLDADMCATVGKIIATTSPATPVPYGAHIEKKCAPGFVLNGDDVFGPGTEFAVCSSTCQYTTNQRACTPRQCTAFTPAGAAVISQPDQYHEKKVTFTCPAGESLAGYEDAWVTCKDEQEVSCNVLAPSIVATGAITAAQNASILSLAGLNLATSGSFVGLTLSIGNGALSAPGLDATSDVRTIVSVSTSGETVVDSPFGVNVSAATTYSIASTFTPASSTLRCTPVTFSQCGRLNTAVGNYKPPDPFGTTTSTASNQGQQIMVQCVDGHRVTAQLLSYSCYPGAEGCTTLDSDAANMADTALQTYTRLCRGCKYSGVKKCSPVECEPHTGNAVSEVPVVLDETLLFGAIMTVPCAEGFASSKPPTAPKRGVPLAANPPRMYTRTCGTEDGLYDNDRVLQAAPGGVLCTPLSCGALTVPANAQVVEASPAYTTAVDYIHTDPVVSLECAVGFRRLDAPSSNEMPCNASFFAKCTSGVWAWGTSSSDVTASAPPACVPISCGRGLLDVCGNESCAWDEGLTAFLPGSVNTTAMAKNSVGANGTQIVECNEGYRAASEDSSLCTDPSSLARDCGYCSFIEDALVCLPVTCPIDVLSDAAATAAADFVLYGAPPVSVACAAGTRASATDFPRAAAPTTYSLSCSLDCMAHPSVQNMSCRAVACPLPSLPNADVLQHAGAGAGGNVSLHGEGVTIRCKAGFKLSGSKSVFSAPCSNASYAMCLDGALMFGAVSDGDASAYSSTTPPTCVPILGCASTAEVCGMEGCAPPPPTAVADPNAIYNASASVAHTASLTVTCKAGYAAVARADVRAGTCDDAGEYQIGCKYCTYAAPEMECRRIQCIWGAAQDPNGQNASSSALALQTVQITCNEGFKVSAGVSAAPTDAASYLATCEGRSCMLSATVACRPIRCSMPALPNARQVEASASGGFAHGDVLGFQCNTSYAASVLPGGGASCADTAYAFCHGGSLFWGAARDTSPLLRTPYTPSGALPLCVAKTCPVLSAVDHPNAVIPAPEVSTGAYPYPNGASSRNLTLQCLPGFRAGPSPAISESPMSYTLQCASCAWLASESGDAATGNSSNAGGDTTSDASPQDTTQDATPQTTAARRLLQEDNGENPWNRCAPARCTPFDSSAPPSSIASIYGIASEATSLVASDGLPYLDTTEVVCAEGFRIKGNNGVRQARVRCTDAGYAPLTLSGIVAAGMEAVDELSAVCVPLMCDTLPKPVNGASINGSVAIGVPAFFSCNTGFYAQGGTCSAQIGSVNSCKNDGKWDVTASCYAVPSAGASSCVYMDANSHPLRDATPFVSNASVTCAPGFAALPANETGRDHITCAVSLSTSYAVTCADCLATPAARCVPLACPAADWLAEDANLEGWSPRDAVRQGGDFLLACKEGFRAGSESDGCSAEGEEGGSCPSDAPTSLAVHCKVSSGTECGLSDRKVACKPVRCSAFPAVANAAPLPPPPPAEDGADGGPGNASTGNASDATTETTPETTPAPERRRRALLQSEDPPGWASEGIFGDAVSYRCAPGFRVAGADNLMSGSCAREASASCGDDGSWGKVPQCVPVTCQIPASPGVVVSPTGAATRPFGTRLTLSCSNLLRPTGVGNSETVCDENCSFVGILECARVTCSAEDLPENSTIEEGVELVFPNTLQVTCDEGFVLSGGFQDYQCATNFSAQCQANGRIESFGTSCVRAKCPPPVQEFGASRMLLVPNGEILTTINPPPAAPGVDSATGNASSPAGNSSNGTEAATPETTPDPAARRRALLQAPDVPVNVWATYGDTITIRCNAGYKLETQLAGGSGDATEALLTCGVSPAPRSACMWERPNHRCVRVNECGDSFTAPASVRMMSATADPDVMTGQCAAGKLSASGMPGLCDASVTARCLYNPTSGAWVWTLLGTDQAALSPDEDPCPGDVTCPLAPIPGVTYRIFGSETESGPGDTVAFGAVVQTSCLEGYEGSGMAPKNVTCSTACGFAPPVASCKVKQCADLLALGAPFDWSTLVTPPAKSAALPLASQVEVKCPSGFSLDATVGFVGPDGFPSEDVTLVAEEIFTTPSRTVATTYSLASMPEVGITFPAGAWPVGETRTLKISVLELKSSAKSLQNVGATRLAGRAVFFSPSGIVFSKPVELKIAFSRFSDFGTDALMVHRYETSSNTWLPKPYSAGRRFPVDTFLGEIFAETMSFSVYAAFAAPTTSTTSETPPATTPAPVAAGPVGTTPADTATPVVTEDEDDTWLRDVIIISSVCGGVALLCVCGCVVWLNRRPSYAEEGGQKEQLEAPPEPTASRGLDGYHMGVYHTGGIPTGGGAHPAIQPESVHPALATPKDVEVGMDEEIDYPGREAALKRANLAQAEQTVMASPFDFPVSGQVPEMNYSSRPNPSPSSARPSGFPTSEPVFAPPPRGVSPSASLQGPGAYDFSLPTGATYLLHQHPAQASLEVGGTQRNNNNGAFPSPQQGYGSPQQQPRDSTPQAYASTAGAAYAALSPSHNNTSIDSFTVEDIASLLPPGWVCCPGCAQPVNAAWHKCPKCGSKPTDPSPSGSPFL